MRRTLLAGVSVLLVLTVLSVVPLCAQTPLPVGPETRANAAVIGPQQTPAVAMATDGSFVVVWTSGNDSIAAGQDGSYAGVYGQRFNASGTPLGPEFRANTFTNSSQFEPAIAMRSTGEFIIAWTTTYQPDSCCGYDVYFQRYNAAGSAIGPETIANTLVPSNQHRPTIAVDGAGNFVVVWQSFDIPLQDGSGYGIYAQRFTSAGAKVGPEFRVNSTTLFNQTGADVAMDASGAFVVVWESDSQDGSGQGLYAQRVTAGGQLIGPEIPVNTTTPNSQKNASIAMVPSGGFIVAWQTDNGPTDGSADAIMARRFDGGGVALGGEFRVNTFTTGAQSAPFVAVETSGAFIVAWQSPGQDGSGTGVYAQRFNAAGAAIGGEFRVNTTTANDQAAPALATAEGALVAVWHSLNQEAAPGTDLGVYLQRYSLPPPGPTGTLQFATSAFTVNEGAGPATITVTRTGGSTGAIAVSYATSNGTATAGADYTTVAASLAWADGDTAAKSFTVPVTNDTSIEAAETIEIALTAPTGGATLGVPASALLTIVDNDAPTATAGTLQFSELTYETSESSNVILTVTRAGGSAGTVSVSYSMIAFTATEVADYTPAAGTLTLGPGETTKTLQVVIIDDTVDEGDEVILVELSNPTGGATLGQGVASVLIHDDDDPVPNAKGPFYLAEGATGFFELEFAVANPNSTPAAIKASFLKPDATIATLELTLLPTSRSTIRVNQIPGLEDTAVSTVVESKEGLPLVVERTMSWDRASRYGAHTERAGEGARRQWFFAEGSQGFFDTYVLLANPQPTTNTATVTFLREGETPVTRSYELPPTSRTNVYAGDIPELENRAFGITVTFAEPGASERAMYFGRTPFWNGGHASVGIAAPATSWYLAEGATGAFFDTYVLVANPNATAANVTYKYLLASGVVITRNVVVPANSRYTVNVELEHPLLADTAVSTLVTSNLPIVAERAMYWPGSAATWAEAHNSFGLTTTGTKWGIAEGRVGGTRRYETYILLANPNDTAVAVTVTYLKTNGTTVTESYSVPATSRFNVYANGVAGLADEEFAAVIVASAPIAVERAMYWNANGQFWAAGTNATASRLP